MKTQNDAKKFNMTYYVNYITGEVIDGRQYGYHEVTINILTKQCKKEYPKEYQAFERYKEEVRKETGEWLNDDDFVCRLLGWSYVDLGDYGYHQAEAYIQTASDKPYSLFWKYVRDKKTHLERHPALGYDAETDSIKEVARDVISEEELKNHLGHLEYQEWNDISDWYNDKPLTKQAKLRLLEKRRDKTWDDESNAKRWREEEEKRQLQNRFSTIGHVYSRRFENAKDLLSKSDEYVKQFGFGYGYLVATPYHFRKVYEQAQKDGFTPESVAEMPRLFSWDIERKISELVSEGAFEQEQPFGDELNKVFAELGIPMQIDSNAYYKIVDGEAIIYENGEPIDMEPSYMHEWDQDGTRLGFIRKGYHIGIFLEEFEIDRPQGIKKLFDIDLNDIFKPISCYRILDENNIGKGGGLLSTDISFTTEYKEIKEKKKLPLDEWLKIPEVSAFLEEVYNCHLKMIGDGEAWDFTEMDSYIQRFQGLKQLQERAIEVEKVPEVQKVWKPYWSNLLSGGINIYLFNDGAETRGYAKFLEDSLGVNVIVGDYRDESTLLRGGHNDFDLLIFDRSHWHALSIASQLAEVCDKTKLIVPVDSFSHNVLLHYLHKGNENQQFEAKNNFEILSNVTRLDYGEINNFPQELAKYIADRLGIEMKDAEQQIQAIELPDMYKLRRSLDDIDFYWKFRKDDEKLDVAMEIDQMLRMISWDGFKEMADALLEPVNRLKELSVDDHKFFRIWHEVAQIREAALRGAKIELATNKKSDFSLHNMDVDSFKLFLIPTIVVGEHDHSLDKGEVLSNGVASGTIKTDMATLDDGDILVCENLFEAQDVVDKVGGIIARHGNFSDHVAVLSSMRNIPVIISDNEYLFAGENITIDGNTGKFYKGKLNIVGGISKEELSRLMSELPSDGAIKVCANADTAYEVDMALSNYAEGIGLVRVENMASKTEEDFYRMAKAAKGKDITFRITKPFDKDQIQAVVLGSHRAGIFPKILIPQIESPNEINIVRSVAGDAHIGSMIEFVAAAKNAHAIAEVSDFIAFGTNDLTADYYGVTRDSTQASDNEYFISISDDVATIMSNAIDEIRKANPNMEIGVCGRQADDDKSMNKFVEMGIDYVSTSPSQVPVIKFAASKNIKLEAHRVKKLTAK